VTLALPQLPNPSTRGIRKSKASKWRALVLTLVHVIIAIHIVQWMITGLTVSPVEPSEAMYTLEKGEVNAGFVFFLLAIGSTLIFGRWFCGWACHVVALQDGCLWLMNRLGVKPKPWRTRLLVIAPLLLGLYMFVWPTVFREAVAPLVAGKEWAMALGWAVRPPAPHFHAAFMVEDFWATFPPWYIAVPFLMVCGFATVYFLGSKGFCTYGCPYGGLFVPADRLAIGRIVVNDKCDSCGHCTAVCTSNVRVHQEVRDYGMVVDPGCMKCLDCVSVCPTNALSFGFARPAILKKARTLEAKAKKVRRPDYDLSLRAESILLLMGFGLFYGFRGMFNQVPMLMAGGIAAIGVFLLYKAWTVLRIENVRLHGFQLKRRGHTTAAGWMFVVVAMVYAFSGVWGSWVKLSLWRGDQLDARITVPYERVMSEGYVPDEEQRRIARAAIGYLTRADSVLRGGAGWSLAAKFPPRLAWLHAVVGDRDGARAWIERSLGYENANEQLALDLVTTMRLGGRSEEDIAAALAGVIERNPDLHQVRMMVAFEAAQRGDLASANRHVEEVVAHLDESTPDAVLAAFQLLSGSGRTPEALRLLESSLTVKALKKSVPLRLTLAQALFALGRKDEAVERMKEAAGLEPNNPVHLRSLAGLLQSVGRTEEAREAESRAERLEEAPTRNR